MHWDFILTSFEPITKVTGGIGTYVRTLLEEIVNDNRSKNLNILFLTSQVVDPDWIIRLNNANLKIVLVDFNKKYGGNELNYVGDEHSYFSFKVADYLETLYRSGDSFGLIEFSDYGRDGYYSIKKRRLGLIDCQSIAVRLHSPDIMLFADNMKALSDLTSDTRYIFQQEIYCYRYCDHVLYGGEAMLNRVEKEVNNYKISILSKSIKIPHPFRVMLNCNQEQKNFDYASRISSDIINIFDDKTKIKLCYTGRIERRKGIYDFVRTINSNVDIIDIINKKNIYIILCGRDTNTGPSGNSLSADIKDTIHNSQLASRIIFAQHVSQIDLYEYILPKSDAYIFPSLFENYPNALIEALPFGKPTLVSSRGCMPEIAESFKFVSSYDPRGVDAVKHIHKFLAGINKSPGKLNDSAENINKQYYGDISHMHNSSMRDLYFKFIDKKYDRVKTHKDKTVSFVIPHYKNTAYIESCLISASRCVKSGDEIIVVDDCSGIEEARFVEKLCKQYGAKSVLLNVNGGPSLARNTGFAIAKSDLIQFIDADDILDENGFNKARYAMEINGEIDFIYGITHTFGATEHLWMPRDVTMSALEENYTHSAILIKRDVFNEAGKFDETLLYHYEDWELNARLAFLGKIGESIPNVTLHYRQKPGSRNISNSDIMANSRTMVIERAINNTITFGAGSSSELQIMRNMGVYLKSWISAAAWIDKLNNDMHTLVLRSRDSERINIGNLDSLSAVHRNFKLAIYDRNFDDQYYEAVKKANNAVLEMDREERIFILKKSSLFDPAYYVEVHPDLKAANVDPYEHYEDFGWKEERSLSSNLSNENIRSILGFNIPKYKISNILIVLSIIVE